MPQIPQYDNPVTKLQPEDAPAHAAEQAGLREGRLLREGTEALMSGAEALGRSAGKIGELYEQAATRSSISKLQHAHADLILNTDQSWGEKRSTADPNQLPAIAHSFQTDLEAQKEKFLSNASTQAAQEKAEQMWDNFYVHQVQRMRVDVAQAQGDAFVANLDSASRSLAGAARHSPATLDQTLSTWDQYVNDLREHTPNLPREKVEEIRVKRAGEIASSGLFGLVQGNPGAAEKLLNSGKYDKYLSPEQQKQLYDAVRITQHQAITDQLSKLHMVETVQRMTSHENTQKLLGSLRSNPDGTVDYSSVPDFGNKVLGMAGRGELSASDAQTLLGHFNRQTIEGLKPKLDPATMRDLGSKMAGGSLQLEDAQGAFVNGKISKAQFDFFHSALSPKANPEENRLFSAGWKTVEDVILDGQGKTADSSVKIANAQGVYLQKLQDGMARGISRGELLNPASPNYIWGSDPKAAITAAGTARAPVNVTSPIISNYQQKLSDAADFTNNLSNIVQHGGMAPTAIISALQTQATSLSPNVAKTISKLTPDDITSGRWASKLVNSSLSAAGFDPNGGDLAGRFKNWGFGVDIADVQKGDVFYNSSEGFANLSPATIIPSAYISAVTQASAQYGVPKELLARILKAESGFNPKALSPKGAQGIAQFIPDTAKEYGVDTHDPTSSILGAAHYLSDLHEKHGSWIGAMTRYLGADPRKDVSYKKSGATQLAEQLDLNGAGQPTEQVGLVVGPFRKRGSTIEVLTASSSGVTWSDASSLTFHRPSPSMEEIAKSAGSKHGSIWHFFHGNPDQPPAETPPENE